MSEEKIRQMIQSDEGYRDTVYADSRGVLTIGYGHALHIGSTMPRAALELLFEQDYDTAAMGYRFLKLNLDPAREAVLTNMIFNLGLSGVLGFKKMLAAIRKKDWAAASRELLDSEYAKQVPARAARLARMMESGEWEGQFK